MLGIVTGLELERKLVLQTFQKTGRTVPLLACAAGTVEGARHAARALIDQGATRLISFGVCGGLSEGIDTGDLIVPRTVMMESETLSLDSEWLESLSRHLPETKSGALISVSEAVTTPEAKAQLHSQSGAVAVDVESFAIAKAAREAGLPCLVIRAVLDPAYQALPQAALNGINAKGETQFWPVIKGLMRRPQDLPDLIRLGQQNKRACGVLVRAVEACGGFQPVNV